MVWWPQGLVHSQRLAYQYFQQDVPPMPQFSTLALKPELLNTLESLSYQHMTPIQEDALPLILSGKDVIGQGKTGSGKTAAFGLGLLQALDVKRFRVQSLVLCPTRELADQVANEIRRLARGIHNIKVLTLCGGMPFGPQIGSLEHGAHIIVGTPGRIEEHLRKGKLSLDDLSMLVLDEADRMLDMGFQEVLTTIVSHAPKNRQTLLFSATYPEHIQDISQRVMREPVMVKVDTAKAPQQIEQRFYEVGNELDARLEGVVLVLLTQKPRSAVVFCNTKRETQSIANELCDRGFAAVALHGDLEQRDRDSTLVRFANESANVLVATDVAARGIDIDTIDMVINYQLARDNEVHTHRIGRTGRAGKSGLACSFYSTKERFKLGQLGLSAEEQEPDRLPPLSALSQKPPPPLMHTLQIDGGKKQKLRAGDVLGALTADDGLGDDGIRGNDVGKIKVLANSTYVAVRRDVSGLALKKLGQGKMKGRTFRVRRVNR